MKQQLLTGVVALTLTFAGPIWAQTDTTTETTTEATETTETTETTEGTSSVADEQFPVAGENSDAPQAGEGYLKVQHEAFEVRCIKAPEGEDEVCRIYNLLNDEDGASVAEFNMTALPAGGKAAAGVDVATPLGSLLTAQILLRVDGGKTNRYPYTWCDQLACYARFGLTQAQIDGMKRGAAAKITLRSIAAPDQPIELEMSLKGFTAAWNEVAPK